MTLHSCAGGKLSGRAERLRGDGCQTEHKIKCAVRFFVLLLVLMMTSSLGGAPLLKVTVSLCVRCMACNCLQAVEAWWLHVVSAQELLK